MNVSSPTAERYRQQGLELIEAGILASVPGLCHGFTTRQGGVSSAPWESMNFSEEVGDSNDNVMSNRRTLLRYLQWPGRLIVPRQVHGSSVAIVGGNSDQDIEVDAMVSREAGMLLGVLVADCVPVLLSDEKGRGIACVHAGWRGTVQRISVHTLRALTSQLRCRPSAVLVAIGPAIGPCCYEVDPPVMDALKHSCPGGGIGTRSGTVDLQEINRRQLMAAGVPEEKIEIVRACTACEEDRFFSFRRDRGQTGRMLGFIGLVSHLSKPSCPHDRCTQS